MSLPINLLITTLLIYVVGAFISLAVRRNEQLSINISGVTGVLAGVLGIVACIPVLISSDTVVDVFKTPFEFASFSIRIDGLAAFMVCVISLLVIVTALYSFSYVKEYNIIVIIIKLIIRAIHGLRITTKQAETAIATKTED